MPIYKNPNIERGFTAEINVSSILQETVTEDIGSYKINFYQPGYGSRPKHWPRFKFINFDDACVAIDQKDYHIRLKSSHLDDLKSKDRKAIIDISAALAEFMGKEVVDYFMNKDNAIDNLKSKIDEFNSLSSYEIKEYKNRGLERVKWKDIIWYNI